MTSRRGSKQRTKGPSASLAGSNSTTTTEMERLRQSEVDNKAKIRALEMDVSTLKARLDGLRKAKNTTIIRREREEIRISSPHSGRHQSPEFSLHTLETGVAAGSTVPPCSHLDEMKELKSQIDSLSTQLLSERASHEEACTAARDRHTSELAVERERHQEDIKKWQDEVKELKKNKNQVLEDERSLALQALQAEVKWLREENSDLSNRLQEVLVSNEALCAGSKLLQEKSEALLEELSLKEAEWSQREDRLNAEIRKQWGDRYHEWMTKAEKKMEELQKINTLLQSMLKTKQQNDL